MKQFEEALNSLLISLVAIVMICVHHSIIIISMMSSNGIILRVTGHL